MIGQDLLDAVAAHADIPVVGVDGRVAVAGDQPDLIAEPEPIGDGRDGEPAVLVRRALVGRGRLVAEQRRPRIEGQRLQPGIDDRPVFGRGGSSPPPRERGSARTPLSARRRGQRHRIRDAEIPMRVHHNEISEIFRCFLRLFSVPQPLLAFGLLTPRRASRGLFGLRYRGYDGMPPIQ